MDKDDMRQAKLRRLAERMFNDLAPWERDDYINIDGIIETLENEPLVVVEWLVDRFMD